MTGRPPNRSSSPPSGVTLHEIARYRGLEFSDEQIQRAVEAFEAFWPKLERLRAVALRYPPPTITPADAFSWIERGAETDDE